MGRIPCRGALSRETERENGEPSCAPCVDTLVLKTPKRKSGRTTTAVRLLLLMPKSGEVEYLVAGSVNKKSPCERISFHGGGFVNRLSSTTERRRVAPFTKKPVLTVPAEKVKLYDYGILQVPRKQATFLAKRRVSPGRPLLRTFSASEINDEPRRSDPDKSQEGSAAP